MKQLRLTCVLILISLLSIISTSGCTIGVKEVVRPIYCGFAKSPEELNGAVSIATNEKIKVTIIGQNDVETTMDLGGMVAIRRADLEELIRKANAASK